MSAGTSCHSSAWAAAFDVKTTVWNRNVKASDTLFPLIWGMIALTAVSNEFRASSRSANWPSFNCVSIFAIEDEACAASLWSWFGVMGIRAQLF
ncbi:hypothetical protein D3C87_1650260 [compost metagenome]